MLARTASALGVKLALVQALGMSTIDNDPTEFWERFYLDRDRWSTDPNAALVAETQDLIPGTALDLGCGQGGDAIWLASKGWNVTAVDLSVNALTRAAEHARSAGLDDRIRWERHDLAASFPSGSFDLVSACYLHAPVALDRDGILTAAAAAVAPSGILLIVGHAGAPSWSSAPPRVRFPTAEETLESLALPDAGWTVERSVEVRQPATSPDGVAGTRPDSVLRLRRH